MGDFNIAKNLFIIAKYLSSSTEAGLGENESMTRIKITPRTTKAVLQDPVVQSIVSLTISLRLKFVKQISAEVTNTLVFFVDKM